MADFLCWLMHNVMIANLVLIVLSVVVCVLFMGVPRPKTGRNKNHSSPFILIEAVLFAFYAQMPASLGFFAINVHHEILGFHHQPGMASGAESFTVVASPVLAIYHLGHMGKDLTMPVKFTLGCSSALGFLTAAAAGMWFMKRQG